MHWLCRWFGHKFQVTILSNDMDFYAPSVFLCCQRCGKVENYNNRAKQEVK